MKVRVCVCVCVCMCVGEWVCRCKRVEEVRSSDDELLTMKADKCIFFSLFRAVIFFFFRGIDAMTI